MQSPRNSKAPGPTRLHRYQLFIKPTCPHCKRLMHLMREKPMLNMATEMTDAVQLKRQGTLPQWLKSVPTIVDHGDVVVKNRTAVKTEPRAFSGTGAFRFVESWKSDSPVGVMGKRFRKKNFARNTLGGGGAGGFVSPYAVTQETFGDLPDAPIATGNGEAKGFQSQRDAMDEMAKQMHKMGASRRR